MRKVPERMCVACRQQKPRTELLRFVRVRGENVIKSNPQGRQPGKGLYVCRDRQCWDRLFSRRNLKRSIAQKIDPESIDWVESSLGDKI